LIAYSPLPSLGNFHGAYTHQCHRGGALESTYNAYLCHYYELDNTTKLIRMQQRAKAYQINNNELYKTSITGSLLHYLRKSECQELLPKIHVGVYGGHIGARVLVAKVHRQGFYWPAVIDDAAKLVATCETYQHFCQWSKALAHPSQLITSSWSLQWWGIDIVSKLTTAQGNNTFVIVAVEYFTKWVEAKPVTNIRFATIKKFFWQNIICRFGVLREITVDNAKLFDNDMFKDFCHQIGTKVAFASVYHTQSNDTIERANALIFEEIKKILKDEKKANGSK
jgi:hypothetical protein